MRCKACNGNIDLPEYCAQCEHEATKAVFDEDMVRSWEPINNSPMDRYILIREGDGYVPDLVRWRYKQPERKINGTLHLAVPAGWFRPSGGRSHITDPKQWLNIAQYSE